MEERKTAGELSLKVASDSTKYDLLEVGHALTDGVVEQLIISAQKHEEIFEIDEFCLILVIAGDPLIKGIRRHKYAAFPFLPKPRPQQAVFLYNRHRQDLKRLWSLPDAKVMAICSEMHQVAPQWQNTKLWCDAFFTGEFFDVIRKQHRISMLSEAEHLDAHREKLIESTGEELSSGLSDSFDFSKILTNKIVDSAESFLK